MSSKAMSLKAKIRNYAKDNRITAQVVLQNYKDAAGPPAVTKHF